MIFNFKNRRYDFNARSYVMGILNITPDSFSDGGKYYAGKVETDKILKDAEQMQRDGADFIDVGGESSRPGAEEVSIGEELERVIPVIEKLKKVIDIPVSIDTYKSAVAEEALKAGAEIVNDISGFRIDNRIAEVTSKYNASSILMHIKGTPKDMQKNPVYENVVEEVYGYLSESVDIARKNNISRIIIDVGIGFGKTLKHNLDLINNLERFSNLGCPVLIGLSNKSFIDKIFPTGIDERLAGTIAGNCVSALNGANIFRVHNVLDNVRALKIIDAIKKEKNN